jgi:chemosensory pili system protein ChpA (sensor histidine kinase/response regulator)
MQANAAPTPADFDQAALRLMRSGESAAASALRDISLGFAGAQGVLQARIFWNLSAAFFEALSLELCAWDLHAKRTLSKILLQQRKLSRGETVIAEQLMHDLLACCAQAAPSAPSAAELSDPVQDEQIRVIGNLRIALPRYNLYLNETDEWSRRLITELGEWSLELHRTLPQNCIELAHSLAGASASVGFAALSEMADALAQALRQAQSRAQGSAAQAQVFLEAAEVIRRLLHQFAAGFLKPADPRLLAALMAIAAQRAPHFSDEVQTLLSQLGGALRQWTARPDNLGARSEVLRVLQAFRDSVGRAGAIDLVEMAQDFNTAIDGLGVESLQTPRLALLLTRFEALEAALAAAIRP